MAVIKNGKIRGKVGNYIYRVMNGVEIIQSYPRKIKVSENTKAENARFSLCSVLSSRVYRVVKDFALNVVEGNLYNRLTSIFRLNLFSSESIIGSIEYREWKLIPSTDKVNLHTKLSDVGTLPRVSFADDKVVISLEEFSMPASVLRYLPNAEYMELVFSLIHYDFDFELARPVYEYSWERQVFGSVVSARMLEVDLSGLEVPVTNGLLLPCFGIRFFAYRESLSYLNSAVFNPFWILGIWYKTMDRGGLLSVISV